MDKGEQLFEAISGMKFSVKAGERAPHTDMEYLRILEEGEQQKDYVKIYEFIHAYERGGFFPHDGKIKEALKRAYEVSPWRLLEVLEQKDTFMQKYAILCMCEKDMLVYFALHARDSRLVYECARQILEKPGSRKACLDNNCDAYPAGSILQTRPRADMGIVAVALRLAGKDIGLWKQFLKENERHARWRENLGAILCKLDHKALAAYAGSLSMDMSIGEAAGITRILEDLPQEGLEHVSGCIAPIIYQRWKSYLVEIKAKKKFMKQLGLNGYCNFILLAISVLFPSYDKWEEEFKGVLAGFEQDMLLWHMSETAMSAYYFTNLTQIYLLLFYKQGRGDWEIDKGTAGAAAGVKKIFLRYKYLWRGIGDGRNAAKSIEEREYSELDRLLSEITGKPR